MIFALFNSEVSKMRKHLSISLCMIVKNEEKFIEQCLNSVKGLVDEMIIVDTGSTDKTAELASGLGAKVIHSAWQGSYSQARNVSLQAARGEWIFLLDADETIAIRDLPHLLALTRHQRYLGYYVTTRNYTDDPTMAGWVPSSNKYDEEKMFLGWFPSTKVRLFRNLPGVKFEGEVHEDVEHSLKRLKGEIGSTPVPVHHFQELKGARVIKEKQLLYQKLCFAKLAKDPKNADTYYEIGKVYHRYADNPAEAEKYLRQALKIDPNHSAAHHELGEVLRREGHYAEAIREYRTTLKINPRDMAARQAFSEARKSWG